MYLVPVQVRASKINGKGVFSLRDITEGEQVWKFDSGCDKTLSVEAFNALNNKTRAELERAAYLSKSGRYVYPPEGDPARFTNHSDNNNLSARYDPKISAEPYFIANRAIAKDEELTNNYTEFDETLKQTRPKWM